jgi:hypothetical protein
LLAGLVGALAPTPKVGMYASDVLDLGWRDRFKGQRDGSFHGCKWQKLDTR